VIFTLGSLPCYSFFCMTSAEEVQLVLMSVSSIPPTLEGPQCNNEGFDPSSISTFF